MAQLRPCRWPPYLLVIAALAPTTASQDREPGATDAPRLYQTIVDDLLGHPRGRQYQTYLTLGTDPTVPWDQRILALARAATLAAGVGDGDGIRRTTDALQDHLDRRLSRGQLEILERGRALGEELRRAVEAGADLDALRETFRRNRAGTQLNLARFDRRPQVSDELLAVQLQEMRAAEQRGDHEEVRRIRDLIATRADLSDRARQRNRLIRRWAREILEWDVAGETDKARRLRAVLHRRRLGAAMPVTNLVEAIDDAPERAPTILARQRQALQRPRIAASLTAAELATVERAHGEAERRIAAGDTEGAVRLLSLAVIFLGSVD